MIAGVRWPRTYIIGMARRRVRKCSARRRVGVSSARGRDGVGSSRRRSPGLHPAHLDAGACKVSVLAPKFTYFVGPHRLCEFGQWGARFLSPPEFPFNGGVKKINFPIQAANVTSLSPPIDTSAPLFLESHARLPPESNLEKF